MFARIAWMVVFVLMGMNVAALLHKFCYKLTSEVML